MGESGTFGFLPDVQKQGYFDVDFKGNSIVLVAGKFIGQIPLTDNIAINVAPKTPIANLERVLDLADQPLRCLDFYRRNYQTSYEKSKPIFLALIESFVISMRELVREGVFKEYRKITEVGSAPHGRLNNRESIYLRSARAHATVLSYSYFDLTADTALNRLIKYCIWYSGNLIASKSSKTVKEVTLARELGEYFDLLDGVKLEPSYRTVSAAIDDLQRRELPTIRRYYLDIVDLSARIVTNESVKMFGHNSQFAVHSYLVNMEDVFERYIRSLLSQSEILSADNIRVLDGNLDGKKYLFNDSKVHVAKPDIVVKRGNEALAIGDVKYKPKVSEQDRYQVICHALSYGTKIAFTVSPFFGEGESGGSTIGTVGLDQTVTLETYQFNLSAEDFSTEENKFLEWIGNLLPKSP